ncbi:MAG: hypothetical protein IT365_26620 [Candidatus Hydrogenedentes bacterium]|nr:hypothetical protein [Candidatus Hydrogenedentota bacterium]
MEYQLTPAERIAVERHQARLSGEYGEDVSFDDALGHWLANEAAAWREERQRKCMAQQREEINRHKWIESEKAGRDLGKEAIMDWIAHNAAAWRNWYEHELIESEQQCPSS